jgi:glycosyltransferase involved in cell wall biosynthesis
LFPSIDVGVSHEDLRGVTVYYSFYPKQHKFSGTVKFCGIPVGFKVFSYLGRGCLRKYLPNYRAVQLRRIISKIAPDVIHAMEIQAAGYLTLKAKKSFHGDFPPWIVTNWGSDIYLFGRLSEHEPKIRDVLSECDYYSCECQRDVELAKKYGFKGKVLSVSPNSGGFELKTISRLRQPGQVSERRCIMLKGYQHWAGRALVGLRALERCVDMLEGYEVVIYSASEDTILAAELFSKSTGVPCRILAENTTHQDILRWHGRARISIGLSISDAISTSLLEAMVMGSFPIQSWTGCADEWIGDEKTGLLVPPEDPDIIESAIRRALTDDELVNHAAEMNYNLAEDRLDRTILQPKAVEMYRRVAQEHNFES